MKTSIITPRLADISFAFLLLGMSTVQAVVLVEDSFNYTAGDINGQTGGTGLENTTGWTTSGGGNTYDVISSGLTFGTLTTSGGAVTRPSYQNDAQMHRSITADLDASSSVWFSVLMRDSTHFHNHITASINLSQGPLDGSLGAAAKDDQQMFTGDAFGVKFQYVSWSGNTDGTGVDVSGVMTDDGVTTTSAGFIEGVERTSQGPSSPDTVYLIVGRLDWGATDTMTLYNLDTTTLWDGTNPDSQYQFATMTGTLDETTLDTISIGDAQIGQFDEIRFGENFSDVVPGLDLSLVPEPSSALLCSLGLLALLRRRR